MSSAVSSRSPGPPSEGKATVHLRRKVVALFAGVATVSNYRRVRLHSMNTHSWAPQAFWVASRNQYAVIYSANNGTRDVFMVNYTTDFINMGTAQVFFDPGFNVLDGDVLVDGSNYYLSYKNLSNGNLFVARSTTGAPNSFTTLPSGLRQGSAIEAPILVKSNTSNTFWLWGDRTRGSRRASTATRGPPSTSGPIRRRSTPSMRPSRRSTRTSWPLWSDGGALHSGTG
jgi:hypothetical protein